VNAPRPSRRYRFHVNLYAWPSSAATAAAATLRGLELATVKAAALDAFLPVTFEESVAALGRLPRLDAEPDGFFVIAGDDDRGRWQVDGHLFDFGDRLHRVELHGECPAEAFDALLRCVGWPGAPLAFELVREGVALDESSFRRWAAGGEDAPARQAPC
jgi:hypothetical protein